MSVLKILNKDIHKAHLSSAQMAGHLRFPSARKNRQI